MATINYQFYKGEENYSDGEIENYLTELAKNREPIEFDKIKSDWAVLYHFTHLRENILNWYPFRPESELLEVGAGCGALTSLFCRKVKTVVSNELTKKRAEIIYERNIDKDNLEIYVGNINNIVFDRKFDYIILNGVFEYACVFTEGDSPYKDFLTYLTSMLKDDGVILIAIENRFGLKYFSGAKEDHICKEYHGINGYSKDDKVRTFSKKEIEEVLESSGLGFYKFYYPYPDYKLPEVIMTDEYLGKSSFKYNLNSFDSEREYHFDEILVNNRLAMDGVGGYFSNSFLIEAGKKDQFEKEKILYVKLSANRDEKYQIGTKIYVDEFGKWKVSKFPLVDKANEHLRLMKKRTEFLQFLHINLLKTNYNNMYLESDFLEGMTLESQLLQLISKNQVNDLYDQLETYLKLLSCTKVFEFGNSEFISVFGDTPKELEMNLSQAVINNVDITFDNIFIDNENYTIIDYEWTFDFPIPVQFVLWRALKNFIEGHPSLQLKISSREIYEHFDINSEMIELFTRWEHHFAHNYVKQTDLSKFVKSYHENSNSLKPEPEAETRLYQCNLFVDTGSGYNDVERIQRSVHLNTFQKLSFDLGRFDNVIGIRFDPIEGIYSECKIKEIIINGNPIKVQSLNGHYIENMDSDVFLTKDPKYFFECIEERVVNIELSLQIKEIEHTEFEKYHHIIIENIIRLNAVLFKEAEISKQELKAFYEEKKLDFEDQIASKNKVIAELEKQILLLENKFEAIKSQKLKSIINIIRNRSL